MDLVVEHYDQEADDYDRRWRHYTAATLDALASLMKLHPGERLLDVPCGTGALEEWLCREHPEIEVVGVDASAAMLARAKSKHARRGYEWIQAEVHNLPFVDSTFDRVVCANSFHCFDRPGVVVREFHRVLKPDGRLAMLDWCDDFLLCRLCSTWFSWTDPAFRRTYGSKECRQLLEEGGFTVERLETFRHRFVWGLMACECVKAT
jgi:ubiquinone/menaquinone biosynthesis C-methylase UbiE